MASPVEQDMLADFAVPLRRLLAEGTAVHLMEIAAGVIVRANRVLEAAAKRSLVGEPLTSLLDPASVSPLGEAAHSGELVLVQLRDANGSPFSLRCAVTTSATSLVVAGEPPMDHQRQLTEQLFSINAELNVLSREGARRARPPVEATLADATSRQANGPTSPRGSIERRMFEMNNELVVTARELTRRTRELEAAKRMIEEQARRDVLTGLFNRRHLLEAMKPEVERAKRGLQAVSIVMVDLDHFKRVNDEKGHGIGDAVLEGTARYMSKNLRPYDVAARYGGEEFILLLPSTTAVQALVVAERLRGGVATLSIAGYEKKVTASFGVAEWTSDETVDAWIARADRALYDAKDAGRNRVVLAATEGLEHVDARAR